MVKETIKYVDYNGEEREEDFHFNISKAELVMLSTSVAGGMEALLDKIIKEKDVVEISKYFEKIIKLAYGIKSPDGKRFMKSEEISRSFMETEAYSELIMKMIMDSAFAAEFVRKMLPKLD